MTIDTLLRTKVSSVMARCPRPRHPGWFVSHNGNECRKAADGGLLVVFEKRRGRRRGYSLMHSLPERFRGWEDYKYQFSTFAREVFEHIDDALGEADDFETRTIAKWRQRLGHDYADPGSTDHWCR